MRWCVITWRATHIKCESLWHVKCLYLSSIYINALAYNYMTSSSNMMTCWLSRCFGGKIWRGISKQETKFTYFWCNFLRASIWTWWLAHRTECFSVVFFGRQCCSMLQCVAACCNVLQRVAVCCSVLQCVAVCCSVLQCVVVCCSVL